MSRLPLLPKLLLPRPPLLKPMLLPLLPPLPRLLPLENLLLVPMLRPRLVLVEKLLLWMVKQRQSLRPSRQPLKPQKEVMACL